MFTATRVLPAEGKVEARGKNKRRRVDGSGGGSDDGNVDEIVDRPSAPSEAATVGDATKGFAVERAADVVHLTTG